MKRFDTTEVRAEARPFETAPPDGPRTPHRQNGNPLGVKISTAVLRKRVERGGNVRSRLTRCWRLCARCEEGFDRTRQDRRQVARPVSGCAMGCPEQANR